MTATTPRAERYTVRTSGEITALEYASLMKAVGWESADVPNLQPYERSLAAYPFHAQARDEHGTLVGLVCAFCDGAFSTFLGEIVVRPDAQRRGVGRRLMEAVEAYAGPVPVTVKAFAESRVFFERIGYRAPTRSLHVLCKRKRQNGGAPEESRDPDPPE